jgi:sodium/proline symporter
MIAGSATVIIWTRFPFLKDTLYEMVPGFAASLLAIVLVSLVTAKPSAKVEEQFEQCTRSA